ncbi:hypothetical protein N7474_004247 [Penicillium riverlandense]|uniref:uncharacterized protein n=1 Tax=Penicillium riverlandense TaxID=1903569 RepID=UPI002546808D|nr:uncharacterized protein N7474_004247 [Penicillium riverlandense]KAJ5818656.1 hypothetical protein N7474_004247 [Penicillium riverlandense]
MSSPPDIDPYATLGVPKDATVSEVRAAHRKRVLKCHPDKIQDESQRNAAQDEFQRVQQAYELLSDETRRARYDHRAKLADLRRELLERRRTTDSTNYSSPRATGSMGTSREYRDGRIYEERVPQEAFLDDELRFTDEPRPMSRKYDDFGMRSKPKFGEDKRKSRTVPVSSYRAAKEQARDTAKATHSERAKYRDKERRRQVWEKFDHAAAHGESDDNASDSSVAAGATFVRLPRLNRRSRTTDSQTAESSRRRERYYDDDNEYSDKHRSLHTQAEDYIERSKVPSSSSRRPRVSRSPQRYRGYESAEPESSASRRAARSTPRRGSSSRNPSYDDLDSSPRPKFPAKMPTASTSPTVKSPRPSLFSSRSATATAFTRSKSSRPESSNLYNMAHETIPSRSSKLHRYDSGYSSPSTPEMPARSNSPAKSSTRYKIVTEPEDLPPSKPKYHRTISPERTERPTPRPPPKRSTTTYSYTPESSPRIETLKPRAERGSSGRPAFRDVEYTTRVNDRDVKYAREIRPDDVLYSNRRAYYDTHRAPPPGRRQSATA